MTSSRFSTSTTRAGSNLRPQLVLGLGQCPLMPPWPRPRSPSMRAGSTCAAWNISRRICGSVLPCGSDARDVGASAVDVATAAHCNAGCRRLRADQWSRRCPTAAADPRAGTYDNEVNPIAGSRARSRPDVYSTSPRALSAPLAPRARDGGFGESMLAERTALRLRRRSSDVLLIYFGENRWPTVEAGWCHRWAWGSRRWRPRGGCTRRGDPCASGRRRPW